MANSFPATWQGYSRLTPAPPPLLPVGGYVNGAGQLIQWPSTRYTAQSESGEYGDWLAVVQMSMPVIGVVWLAWDNYLTVADAKNAVFTKFGRCRGMVVKRDDWSNVQELHNVAVAPVFSGALLTLPDLRVMVLLDSELDPFSEEVVNQIGSVFSIDTVIANEDDSADIAYEWMGSLSILGVSVDIPKGVVSVTPASTSI